jgi:cation diffusion facilitator CzcD-associated flavoprotein CzcO
VIPHHHVVIVGAGFSGIGAAIKLLERGERDFVVLEAADEVGGVWRDNVYPGCGCDVESPLYSFSFALNPHWSRMYSPQPEILAYLREVADRFGVRPYLRFGQRVERACWDASARRWEIETGAGRFTADVLIAGMGGLHEPNIPSLPGAERFSGRAYHSARWDSSDPIDGRRIAVIGTGASAIQIVPKLQRRAAELVLFQRTPAWVIPRHDRAFGPVERRLFEAVPLAQKLLRASIYLRHEAFIVGFRNPALMRVAQRLARGYLARQIRDPALREQLTPRFTMGCKRVLLSDDYYPALTKPNVTLVTAGITELTPTGIVDASGRSHALDTIVYATGFHVSYPPFADKVHGRGGRTLAEVWAGSPSAHLGTTVAGFPNLFLMTGPNTGLGHNSMILMIEAQLELIMAALEQIRGGGASLEPRGAAQAQWVDEVRRGNEDTVWTAGGCSSWYLDETGANSTLWPWTTHAFARRAKFELDEYLIER